jgi:DNA-binding NarL/FixJ family response regulator
VTEAVQDATRGRLSGLSAREIDILRHLAEGHTNPEIAHALGVAPGTVRNGIARITTKLRLVDRTQAALLAYRSGLRVRV